MSENSSMSIKDILMSLGKLVAFVMVVRYALLIVNYYTGFLGNNEVIITIINYVGTYAPLALMTLVALCAVWDKSELLRIVVAAVCAAVIIISFFPDVAQSITSWLNIKEIGPIQ